MDGNLTQPLVADSQEMQKAMMQAMVEAVKNLPQPQMPPWLQALIEFIKIHPWISLFAFLLVLLVLSILTREVVCSYLKTNEILARLKKIENKFKDE